MILLKYLAILGRYLMLMGRTFSVPERMRMFFKSYVKEMAQLGVNSIGIVLLISFFIGAVICIQMKLNIQSPWMPRWVSGYTTREILLLEFSSSIMCLILAGKVGSNIASELGTMRVTQQIDALEIMGVNSASYLILPKIMGMLTIMPFLVIFSSATGILGAYATLSSLMELYFSPDIGNVLADDLLEATMKNVMANLEIVLENPNDYRARASLMWASSLAENRMLKCGKDGLYQVRNIANQISANTGCPYGQALAAIQSQYYRFVKVTSALMTWQLKRFAVNVFGVDPQNKTDINIAIEGVDALLAWTKKIGAYHTLTELGVTMETVPRIAKATKIVPMKYCRLNSDDIEILLEQCL